MGLKIKLKPNETIYIGSAVIQNAPDSAATLLIKNKVPVLRSKDVLQEEQAVTPVKRLYFLIQLVYMFGADGARLKQLARQVSAVGQASPHLLPGAVDAALAAQDGDCYQALKIAKKLIREEAALFPELYPDGVDGGTAEDERVSDQ